MWTKQERRCNSSALSKYKYWVRRLEIIRIQPIKDHGSTEQANEGLACSWPVASLLRGSQGSRQARCRQAATQGGEHASQGVEATPEGR